MDIYEKTDSFSMQGPVSITQATPRESQLDLSAEDKAKKMILTYSLIPRTFSCRKFVTRQQKRIDMLKMHLSFYLRHKK